MAHEFGCSECGAKIAVHFSRPGDFVVCHNCGASNAVPALGQELPIKSAEPWSDPFAHHGNEAVSVGVFSNEPLSVGLILRETFRMFFAEFGRISAIAAMGLSPILFLEFIGFARRGQPITDGTSPASAYLYILLLPLYLVAWQVSTAALTYGVLQLVRGEALEIDKCLRVGFRRFFRVLLVSFGIGFFTTIGAMLCIVPGIIIYIQLAVAIPVAVVEGTSASDSLRRSRNLTAWAGGTIFGALGVIWVLSIVAYLVLALLPKGAPLTSVVSTAVDITTTGLYLTMLAVLYYVLRSRKESIGVEEIAAVFE